MLWIAITENCKKITLRDWLQVSRAKLAWSRSEISHQRLTFRLDESPDEKEQAAENVRQKDRGMGVELQGKKSMRRRRRNVHGNSEHFSIVLFTLYFCK